MKTKKSFFFLLFIFIHTLINAQVVPYERYTSKNGLISDRITAITQDEKGFMWFGSFFGICRYNGIKFEKIALHPKQQNKYVTFLLPANNKMYAGFLFQGGLAEFSNGKVTAHFIKTKDSASVNEFSCISNNNDGSILLGNSARQIYQFKNNDFIHLYTLKQKRSSYPTSIVKDKYNNLWLGTENGLFIVPYPYTDEQQYFSTSSIFSIIKDDKEKIWFSRRDGLYTITESSDGWHGGKLLNQTTVINSPALYPVPFSGNMARGFWGVDLRKGLVNISNNNEDYYKIPFEESTGINKIYGDRENNIWIANEPGVIKVTNQSVKTFFFEELAPGGSYVLQENDSVVWVTNSKFLYRIHGNSFTKVPEFRYNKEGYISTFIKDGQNYLWVAFWDGGVAKTKWKGRKLIIDKHFSYHQDKEITGVLAITGDTVWVLGANGIFLIKNDIVINHFHPKNANGHPVVITAFAMDKQRRQLWIGDNAAGIIKVNFTEENGIFSYTVSEYITEKNGLKDMAVRSLMLDKNKDLWIGTRYGGIYRLSTNESKKLLVEAVTTKAGLECTRTTHIIEEKNKAAWFATCDGIYRYLYNTNQWEQYNTGNGLVNAEIFSLAVDEKNSRLWAAGTEGVSELKIGEKIQDLPPLVNLIDITVLGRSDTSALYSSAPKKYEYNQNSIGFVFAGASFIDEKQIKYKYTLQGYDKNWSEPAITNNVNYASLPPGKYIFKVLAANVKNQWSSHPAIFEFEIIMPVYKRPWFIVMLIIIALFIIYAIRLQRLKQRYKIEKLRLNIAGDLHDDIGSTLGSINLLSKTATRRLDQNQSGEDISLIFQKIGQSAENTLEAMDDIVWSINPEKDKVEDLILRMREFAIPLLEAQNISFSFNVKGKSEIALPMNLRRNLFLIFKEAIHNILKHSKAGKVDIKLNTHHNLFLMEILDNGKGFNTELPSSRNGVKNMHRRAEAIGGALQINSSKGYTSILFTAPIR